MRQQNIDILEAQRPRVELFFKTGSLVLNANEMPGASQCEKCIDTTALVKVMREEWEPAANLNPYTDWLEDDGYKGFLSRLYVHYDAWKIKNPLGETNGLCTNQSI